MLATTHRPVKQFLILNSFVTTFTTFVAFLTHALSSSSIGLIQLILNNNLPLKLWLIHISLYTVGTDSLY